MTKQTPRNEEAAETLLREAMDAFDTEVEGWVHWPTDTEEENIEIEIHPALYVEKTEDGHNVTWPCPHSITIDAITERFSEVQAVLWGERGQQVAIDGRLAVPASGDVLDISLRAYFSPLDTHREAAIEQYEANLKIN